MNEINRRPARSGFTLMEMLIVVAIIAVLVAIAIPVFMGQLAQARRAADMANARSAYAVASAQALTEPSEGTTVAYYDPGSSQLKDSAAGISAYGQWEDAADYEVGGKRVTGKASGNVLRVTTKDGVVESMAWGAGGLGTWSTLSTTVESDEWWNNTTQRKEAFETLRQTDNATRKKSDVEVLSAIAGYFEGMSSEEALKILGEKRYNKAKSNDGATMFEYGQDGGGSIRLKSFDTNYQPYFEAIGFDAKNLVNRNGSEYKSETYENGVNNYVNKYLFTSDEMLGTNYGSKVFNNVNIKFTETNGTITGAEVWVNNKKNDGFTSAQ